MLWVWIFRPRYWGGQERQCLPLWVPQQWPWVPLPGRPIWTSELLSEWYPSCQPLSPAGTGEDYYRLSLPWEFACKTPMLSSNCIDLMLSDAKMHSLSCSEVSSILFWLADRITHMSQRLMLTALKSARLNGVPFGREERKKNRWSKSETEGREGKREKKHTHKLKIVLELWEII